MKQTCAKCGGNGIYHYADHATGVCFPCNGTGKVFQRPVHAPVAPQKSFPDHDHAMASLRVIYVSTKAGNALYLPSFNTFLNWVRVEERAKIVKAFLALPSAREGLEILFQDNLEQLAQIEAA